MNKSISAIIPTWNRAECLKKCIPRIQDQSVGDIEIIISDDGSNDETEQVVQSFSNTKIKYVLNPNSGLPAVARNRGLRVATHEYVAFCDSDDYWVNHKLEKQLKAMDQQNVLAACSNAFLDQTKETYFQDQSRKLTTLDLLRVNSVICSSMIVDKKLVDQCEHFNESKDFKAVEDYLLWLKISLFTDIFYTNEPLLEYTTNSVNSVRIDQELNEQLRYQRILKNFFQFSIKEKKYFPAFLTLYFLAKSKLRVILRGYK